jgi:hypothetical protein
MNKIWFYDENEKSSSIFKADRVQSSRAFSITPGEKWMIIMPSTYNIYRIYSCCDKLVPTHNMRTIVVVENMSMYDLYIPDKTALYRLLEMPTICFKIAQILIEDIRYPNKETLV